jgi:ABC-type nickel/cobalt efflux system permease component RcnA
MCDPPAADPSGESPLLLLLLSSSAAAAGVLANALLLRRVCVDSSSPVASHVVVLQLLASSTWTAYSACAREVPLGVVSVANVVLHATSAWLLRRRSRRGADRDHAHRSSGRRHHHHHHHHLSPPPPSSSRAHPAVIAGFVLGDDSTDSLPSLPPPSPSAA